VLIWFATRISTRIRRLRDEARRRSTRAGASPISSRAETRATSSRSLAQFLGMLGKLSQHHAYLESMASRLSHELRTPIAWCAARSRT